MAVVPIVQVEGRYTRLRNLGESDLPQLHKLAANVDWGAGSLLGGLTLAPAEFSSLLMGLERAMVGETQGGQLAGLVVPYRYSTTARRTFLSVLTNVEQVSRWTRAEILVLALQWLFSSGVERVFFEIPSFNQTHFTRQLARYCEPRGTMESHWYLMGNWWDVAIFELTRESFDMRPLARHDRNRTPTPTDAKGVPK